MTATTTGLTPAAATAADERIKGAVEAVVSAAVADDDRECLEGEPKCGYFEQTLKPIACRNGYLCLEQHVTAAPVGLAISDEQVAVLVLDPATGRTANVSDVVSESDREGFLAAVNEAVTEVQQSFNVYDASDAPNFTEPDFAAWAPVAEGVRVWFAKYTAGPGAMGVVDVTVPGAFGPSTPPESEGLPEPTSFTRSAVRADAVTVCADFGMNDGISRISIARRDFDGDGIPDAVAGFTCNPNAESPWVMVFYWLSRGPDVDYPRIVYDFVNAFAVTGVRIVDGDVEVETEESSGTAWRVFSWTGDDWELKYEKVG